MATNGIDWDGLINRALNTAIDIIGRKIEGVKTPVGAGVQISPTGLSFYSSNVVLPFLIIATLTIGVILLVRKL